MTSEEEQDEIDATHIKVLAGQVCTLLQKNTRGPEMAVSVLALSFALIVAATMPVDKDREARRAMMRVVRDSLMHLRTEGATMQ